MRFGAYHRSRFHKCKCECCFRRRPAVAVGKTRVSKGFELITERSAASTDNGRRNVAIALGRFKRHGIDSIGSLVPLAKVHLVLRAGNAPSTEGMFNEPWPKRIRQRRAHQRGICRGRSSKGTRRDKFRTSGDNSVAMLSRVPDLLHAANRCKLSGTGRRQERFILPSASGALAVPCDRRCSSHAKPSAPAQETAARPG